MKSGSMSSYRAAGAFGPQEPDDPPPQVAVGTLHNATNLDSVRIEVVGETRALTIPCSLILSIDDALKECREIRTALIVYPIQEGNWLAECGGKFVGCGATPMQAIAAMENHP